MVVRSLRVLHPLVQKRLCTMSLLTEQPMPPAYQEKDDEMARPLATSSNTGWGHVTPRNAHHRNRRNSQLPRNWFDEDDYVPGTRGPKYTSSKPAPPKQEASRSTEPSGRRENDENMPKEAQARPQQTPRLVTHQRDSTKLNKPPTSMTDFHRLNSDYNRGRFALHKNVAEHVVKQIKNCLGSMGFVEKVEAIGLAGKIGRPDFGLELLEGLEDPSAKAFTLAMSGFAKKGDFANMQVVWARMRECGLVGNVFTYNVVMNCFAEMRDEEKARELIKIMHSDGVRADLVTYNTAIRSAQNAESAMRFYRELCELQFVPDKFTLRSLLDVCAQTGDTDAAQLVINDMASKDLLPDVQCCNLLLKMHLRLKDPSALLGVVSTMRSERIKENSETYEILTALCLQKALQMSDTWHKLACTILKDLDGSTQLTAITLENIAVTCDKVGDKEGAQEARKLIVD